MYWEGEEGARATGFLSKIGKIQEGLIWTPTKKKKRGHLGVSEAAVLVLALAQGVQAV